ncbi:MAG: hypothetical protein WEC33_00275, partial [Dehalococcoidia bacterium]
MTEPTGGLTDPEERLIGYIRAGTLDAEIAVRLGIPVGEVKDRTERLFRKLALPDRAALASFDPATHPATPAFEPVAEPADATPHSGSPRGALLGLLATGVAAVGALIAVAFLSDGSPSPFEGASPTRTPTPEGGPTPIHETDVQVEDGGEFDLFDYSYLYLTGEPTRVERLSRQGREDPVIRTLFQPSAPACIRSAAASADSRHLIVAVDPDGDCFFRFDSDATGPGPATSNGASTAFYYSDDAGVTWSMFAALEGRHWVVAVTRRANTDIVQEAPTALLLLDVGAEQLRYGYLSLDGTVEQVAHDGRPVGVDLGGDAVWLSGSPPTLSSEGEGLPAPQLPVDSFVRTWLPLPDGRRYLLSWDEPRPGATAAFWGMVDRGTGALIQSWEDSSEMFLHQAFTVPVYGAVGYEFTASGKRPILLWFDGPVLYELAGDHWASLAAADVYPLAVRFGAPGSLYSLRPE